MRVDLPNATLFLGNCLDLYKELEGNALITDPPYGCKNACSYGRNYWDKEDRKMRGITLPTLPRKEWPRVVGDDVPFDPKPWLSYSKVCLFGYNHFAARLPIGTVFVWVKKRPNAIGLGYNSDAELAWYNKGKGVYVLNHEWQGFMQASERGKKRLHPVQKPIQIFSDFIFPRMKLQPGDTVVDPYMGTGPIGIACKRLGLKYIGVEIVPEYFDIAVERIKKE